MESPESIAQLVREQRFAEAADCEAVTPTERFERGMARIHVGREDEARRDLEVSLPDIGDRAVLELALLDIRQRGDLEAAYHTVLRIAEDAPTGGEQAARARHVLGLAEGKRRHTSAAVSALLEAIEIYGVLGMSLAEAQVRDTLGSVFVAQGRLDLAASAYALSIVTKITGGDRYGAAVTLGNLGRLHLRAGRTLDAIACLSQDLTIATELHDSRGRARVLEDLGRLWMDTGESESAIDCLGQALQLASEHGYRDLEFFTHKDLALLHARDGRHGQAATELERAAHALPGGEPYLATILRAAEGECLLARGDRRALELVAGAAEEFQRLELPDLEIDARIVLAQVLIKRGKWDLAEDALRRASARARMDGYARFLPRIREEMTRLRIVPGLTPEEDRVAANPRAGEAVSDAALRAGYVMLECIGVGGYGEVWRAYDPEIGQFVAIKTMVLDEIYTPDERMVREESLHRELEAGSRIRHPGVVRVFAVGTDANERMYVVQEYVRGRPLSASIPKLPNSDVAEVVCTLGRIAGALDELHLQGVVHRDLKPANVVLREGSGLPVLIDFGFASIADLKHDWERGQLVGTMHYMSPEQAAGRQLDGSADVFALGVIAYEWLTGTRPFRLRVRGFREIARELERQSPPPITEFRPGVPAALAQLVHACLQFRPEDRPTAAQSGRTLRDILEDFPAAADSRVRR